MRVRKLHRSMASARKLLPPSSAAETILVRGGEGMEETDCGYSMPTFLVFKSGVVIETIRGADPSALTAAVRKAVIDASSTPASRGAHFSSKGYTLGSATTPSRPANTGVFANLQSMASGNGGFGDKVVRFFALYFVSLFAFDGFKAAEESPFSVRGRR